MIGAETMQLHRAPMNRRVVSLPFGGKLAVIQWIIALDVCGIFLPGRDDEAMTKCG